MNADKIKNTQGVKSLLLNNDPAAVRDLVKKLDVQKAEYLKMVFLAQQDAGKGAVEANYYRRNIKYGGIAFLFVYLTFFFVGWATATWAPSFYKTLAMAIVRNKWVWSGVVATTACAIFNYFDWLKIFAMDHYYASKWQEDLEEEVPQSEEEEEKVITTDKSVENEC